MGVGLTWPPPFKLPPPAVTRDLHTFRKRYNKLRAGHTGKRWHRDLGTTMATINKKANALLHQLDSATAAPAVIEKTKELCTGDKKNAVMNFLAGLALAISLAQGSGAFHNLPEDLRDFHGDIEAMRRALVAVVEDIGDEVSRLVGDYF